MSYNLVIVDSGEGTWHAVKYVFVFDCFQRAYLNYIEIRVYLYLYLTENGLFVFVLFEKSEFDPSPG